MIRALIIGITTCATFLLSACSESVPASLLPSEEEELLVDFTVNTQSINADIETEVVPMVRNVQDYNDFYYSSSVFIVFKKTDKMRDGKDVYSVVGNYNLSAYNSGNALFNPSNVKTSDLVLNINSLVLQPGEYKTIVIVNGEISHDLSPLKEITEDDNILTSDFYNSPNSLFVGTNHFTVTKNKTLEDADGLIDRVDHQLVRYTTPVNIILRSSKLISEYRNIRVSVDYAYPIGMNFNGDLIYGDSSKEAYNYDIISDFSVMVGEGSYWNFASFLRGGSFPVFYTKGGVVEANIEVNEIRSNTFSFFEGKYALENLRIEDGKPLNILLDLKETYEITPEGSLIIKWDIVDANWEASELQSLWKNAGIMIPLNYVEYNPGYYGNN